MKNLSKDYKLLVLVSVFTSLATLLLFNIKDVLDNSIVWQVALIGLGAVVVFALVNIFILSQKLRENTPAKA